MLRELRVENLLLIERAELCLAPGLNVLTGETGAGKTVLAHALDLLLGGRARTGIVRPGAAEAYVEGTFEVPGDLPAQTAERLPADAGEVVLARRVGSDGRTRAYLNGRTATVAELRDLGGALVSFYGQHEHRKLTLAAAQLEILDGLCGPEHALALRACAQAFAETGRLQAELDALRELSGARERELDLLEYELAEIDSAALTEEEHDELLRARERLRRLDALRSAAGAGAEALAPEASDFPGAVQLMATAAPGLDALDGVDPRLDILAERLRGLLLESEDLAGELRRYCEEPEVSTTGQEGGLAEIEERLVVIERLLRKHGGSIQAVLDHGARARARRDQLAGVGDALAQTEEELREAAASLEKHADGLHSARAQAAPRLALSVGEQLASLAMAEASFEVILSAREAGPGGADSVEFLIAPNPGVPAGPLREIASGGELSRVMLAIMSVAAAPSSDSTLVFDEVDAGIGGKVGLMVGDAMRRVAEHHQVFAITHLPQIAARAHHHIVVSKGAKGGVTTADITVVEGEARVHEVARLLGGDPESRLSREHATELLAAAGASALEGSRRRKK